MKTVSVKASINYEVIIGEGILPKSGELISSLIRPCKVCVLTDDIVDGLYFEIVEKSLNEQGYAVSKYVIRNGERSKNAENYVGFLNFLANSGFTRTDALVALGGGVVGDLCGFTAATFLRGIKYVQIPTTVLAMVDSSVGGKTAIDLDAGKNLCGAFYQPSLVICSYDTANTLPKNIFSDGMAEVIKYGVIKDSELFRHLAKKTWDFDREYVISRCVEIKRDIVEEDEFDHGQRQLLNFGHTAGHGIEKLSNYGISHGSAVAKGMLIAAKAAEKYGMCKEPCSEEISSLIGAFGLDGTCAYSAHELYETMLSDKKRRGGRISLVLPEKIGYAILKDIGVDEYEEFIDHGEL
ncbi:MAG: 3-dehydroquinate synthase [Ruminococcaceae bacterium]|nr:3-dehydroquinate synthase [Oscillospiraceae bacterium]